MNLPRKAGPRRMRLGVILFVQTYLCGFHRQGVADRNDRIRTSIISFSRLRSVALILGALALWLFAGRSSALAQGALVNGYTHTGTISPVGDFDAWTFSATTGDHITIRVGEMTQTGNFTPRLRLTTPTAVQQALASGATAAEISVTATNTGVFTVTVDDAVGTSATGTYRITLFKGPGTISVAQGDEGGPLTNGLTHTGVIEVGDLDVFTLTATNGDTLMLEAGEVNVGSSLTPALWLYGPDGRLLDSAYGASAAQVGFRATNSGTFFVIVGDFSSAYAGSGPYRLSLAKTRETIVVAPGDDGGPLTNGVMHAGTIDLGDLDTWSFNASSGDTITLMCGETVSGSFLTPAVWLYGPDGRLLDSGYGVAATQVGFRATNSGTFLVVVGDFSSAYAGSGSYRLTLAKTGSPLVISAGDEGGPMNNGAIHTGTIDVGDIDAWTFDATKGDTMILEIGEASVGSGLTPAIWFYGTDGRLLDSSYGTAAAQVSFRATNSGTFFVVVGDYSSGFAGSGPYKVTLAKTGSPFVVSPGDQGGPLTNGVTHAGTIDVGEVDMWSFSANSGDSITLEVGEGAAGSSLTPVVWLYGPDGQLLDWSYGTGAAQVGTRATNSGTFTAIVGDYSSGFTGSGAYQVTLGKTGSPIIITPGDEGGPLTNGMIHIGTIYLGDIDTWTFSAKAGDSLIVSVGETAVGSSLTPAVWLYGPDGRLLDSSYGTVAAQVSVRATNSGVFTVVVGDYSSAFGGSGGYRLTLAKAPGDVYVTPGDEGGALIGRDSYDGTIDPGDVDVYYFTACTGDVLTFRMDEALVGSSLTPYIRLFGRDGTFLGFSYGAAGAQLSVRATNNGTYTLVLGDLSSAFAGSGGYKLTVNGLSAGIKLCPPVITGNTGTLAGIGGTNATTFVLLTHTNVTEPLTTWQPMRTNVFDQYGAFTLTNIFLKTEPQRYFDLKVP